MIRFHGTAAAVAAVAMLFAPGCDSSSTRADTFTVTYHPEFAPAENQTDVTNASYPLPVGAIWRYRGETEDGTEIVEVEVLQQTRTVAGIEARVVRDRVFIEGELIEDTYDWFSQDAAGNVWYLGEETEEYANGEVVSTEGSWEAGVDGAVAGIIMPASPTAGQAYYQEFYEDVAEDRGRILVVGESVTVPVGSYSNRVKTEDTTPLEPDVLEHKYYSPGIGTVLEVDMEDDLRVELIEVIMP